MNTVDSAITKPVRRLEVFTGAGRRRTCSDEHKTRVVAEIETSIGYGFVAISIRTMGTRPFRLRIGRPK